MSKIAELFTSRKFWLMVIAVVGTIGAALAGEITMSQAIMTSVAAIMAWITGQAIVDARKSQ